MRKYSKSQIDESFHYLVDHPEELHTRDITELRYIVRRIKYCLMYVDEGIEDLNAIATISDDGTLVKDPQYYHEDFLMYWADLIDKQIEILRNKRKSGSENVNKSSNSLRGIWEGTNEQYYKTLDFLTTDYPEIEGSFVTPMENGLQWNKKPPKGWRLYLAAFIYTCLENRYIADIYSAPTYKKILGNTFNIDFDHTKFKSLSTSPPEEKYLKPFKLLPK